MTPSKTSRKRAAKAIKALGLATVALFSAVALAGGPRTPAGYLFLPITGAVHQFDGKKIEVSVQKRIVILNRSYSGLPKNLEPRPDQTVQLQLTLKDWKTLSERFADSAPGSRIDLRDLSP